MNIERKYIRQFLNENKKPAKDFNYYRRKVAIDPRNLEKVPDEFKTPELCKIAVETSRSALKYVPDELKAQVKKELGLK